MSQARVDLGPLRLGDYEAYQTSELWGSYPNDADDFSIGVSRGIDPQWLAVPPRPHVTSQGTVKGPRRNPWERKTSRQTTDCLVRSSSQSRGK